MLSEEMTKELETAVEGLEIEGEEVDTREVESQEITKETTGSLESELPGIIDETTEEIPTEEIQEEIPTEETTAEEIPPALSDEILERAVNIGIPVVDARGLSPESLTRVIERREANWAAEAARAEELRQRREQEIISEKGKTEEPVDPFADFPELDPEVHDSATIAMFEKLKGIAKQQHETIQGFGTRQEEADFAAAAVNRRDTVKWFDKQVSDLGEDFVDALGTGGYDTLDRGSAQFARREILANQVSVLLAGYEAIGQQAPPHEEVFDMAARLVLHEEYQQIHEKGLSGALEKRASQHIQRASGQKATGKETPLEEAARMIDEKYF